MFNQISFGEKLKSHRKNKNFTQDEVAEKIGVSGQAVSKWEKGECLPDVYNLKLLGRLYRISVDSLLDTEDGGAEKVIETLKVNGATFEVVERPAAVFAGKILYAKDFPDVKSFYSAIESLDEIQQKAVRDKVIDCVLPVSDINLSANFWLEDKYRALGFVRETTTEHQPDGVDVYKMPTSLYIRGYTDEAMARLIFLKERCEIWELFASIRNYVMPAHGFKMNENGAQELEIYDTAEHKAGYAYMPVVRIK